MAVGVAGVQRAALVLAGALAATALAVGPARAATVSASGGTVTIGAAPGERNQIEIWYPNQKSDDGVIFVQDGHDPPFRPITAGAGCSQRPPEAVQCDTGVPSPRLVIGLGDGDDDVETHGSPARFYSGIVVDAGPGNDKVRFNLLDVSEGDPRVPPRTPIHTAGGAGNDLLYGSRSSDILDGGPGNDTVHGGDGGADRLSGGPGADQLAVAVNTFDGAAGGTFLGGPGPDKIATGARPAALVDAGGGDDRVLGGCLGCDAAGRIVQLPARSSTPIRCGSGRDRIRTTRAQRRIGCERSL
jgi:hypothetical protein